MGPGFADDPALLGNAARALDGVVGSSNADPEQLRGYMRAFVRGFAGVSASVAGSDQVSGYRDAVEAVLRGLEQADGDTAHLQAALGRLRLDLLGGRVGLDEHRQAVVTTRLARITAAADPALVPLGSVPDVDQSIGGLLARSASPSDRPRGCRHDQRPPPWTH